MFSRGRLILSVMTVGLYIGCSEVEFGAAPFDPTVFERNTLCEQVGDVVHCSGSKKAGIVDILFVDDNSGSMYEEQTKMAVKFPTFISSIQNLDFHIGIITTDVSASPYNPNLFGELQDGNLIPFSLGTKVLTNESPDVVSQFAEAIQRNETLNCDKGYASCPSGDERAIYAANLAIDKADSDFFRGDAHLAMVILSDEDERSNGGKISGYGLEEYDRPKELVRKVGTAFGKDKTMSVHAVVIKPGDLGCFKKQNSQAGVKGFYANTYAELADPSDDLKSSGNIIKGHLGSICADDYGVELGNISEKLKDNVNRIPFFCNPIADSIKVSFDPAPSSPIEFFVNGENHLVLSPPAPAGTNVIYDYDCTLADARESH